jgi:RimJ/RimL family protein N-acetyltransferase
VSDPVSTITLRDVTDADLPVLFAHQDDPEAARMAAFGSRDREAFFAHWRDNVLGNPANRKQAILVDGVVAGNVVSWGPDEERLVGYWIGRDHWGKGVATAALRAFLDLEPVRPLFAHVVAHNIGSIRVLEKCGFVRIRRQTVPFEDREIEEFVYELPPADATPNP